MANKKQVLKVNGMTCGGCAGRVKAGLEAAPGITGIEVDLGAGEVTVSYSCCETSPNQIQELISSLGYPAELV